MIRTKKNWISLSLAAVVLLTAGVVWAQPRHGGGRFGPPGAGFGPGPGAAAMLLHGPLGERLELTDEQRERILGIVEAQRQAGQPRHEDMKSLAGALEEAVEAEPFDEEAVRAVAQQLADVRVEVAVERARTAQEVRAVLTPEQRETLGELRAQRRQMRDDFGGRERGGGRGYHRRGAGG